MFRILRNIYYIIFGFLAFSLSFMSHAANEVNNQIMGTCQPDARSINSKTCRTGGHGVFHTGASGTCRLLCKIEPSEKKRTWNGPRIFGKDPDGSGTDFRIVANFLKAKLGSNRSEKICSVDSNFRSSNPSGPVVDEEVFRNYRTMNCRGFSTIRTDKQAWYWAEVIITKRAGAAGEVEALGYGISFR